MKTIILLAAVAMAGGPAWAEPVITRRQIEDDWLRQEAVRGIPPAPSRQPAMKVTPDRDAAGAVDGVKNGRWGFHTEADPKPWWQVDLGQVMPLDHVLIYNRCDERMAAARAAKLLVLVSDDAAQWKQVYQHNGHPFGGQPDRRPLRVSLAGTSARWVRIQLPGKGYLHLDEVEVYRMVASYPVNVAWNRPATQSSVSRWSALKRDPAAQASREAPPLAPEELLKRLAVVVERGRRLAASLRRLGAKVDAEAAALERAASQGQSQSARESYLAARWAVRRMALKNPLLDFDDLLFVKRVPGSFTHMSDQYYGWFSRPGGGLFVLEGFKTDAPRLRCLSDDLPPGSVLRPDLSHDGRRVLFAYCRHHPGLADEPDKLDKANVPEDAFYHVYEVNLDGTGLRRLSRGKYDDFDARYLPDGRIVFLSTRRGRFVQCGPTSAAQRQDGSGGDCYVRCGGGPSRPVAVYTLHVMQPDGRDIRPLSPFEMFEWTPSIDNQGRILYARWDYVDRHNMPFMKLWATLPDGTNPQAVFGNYTRNPHCTFEARAIPNSHRLICTAGGHHALTGGSLVLLDPRRGMDGDEPMVRLTPEVCFPESEGWPQTYFGGPYPLSEEHYLVAWSDQPLPPGVPPPGWGVAGPANDLGLYLFDALGNLNLIYRDPAIGSETPLPVRPQARPLQVASAVRWNGPAEGTLLLADVYCGLGSIPRGAIGGLRLVGIPPKTHPTMNQPVMGLTHDDPGKFVLGTVPVESDGSAHFRVPAGVTIFFQALDQKGMAVQTMRSGVYVQPGQTYSCIGCHEHRATAPPPAVAAAFRRPPSKITPGPAGSWPLDYEALVQPVLQRHCVGCHRPGAKDAGFDLAAAKSYDTLVAYGRPSLADHVRARYAEGRSLAGQGAAQTNALVGLLEKGHYKVRLARAEWDGLLTWMDTYAQRRGSFDAEQEEELRRLRSAMASMLKK